MYVDKLKISFLGTGTSQGVPVIACDCDVCTSPHSKDKRLRSSILVEQGDLSFVIDTGPDFRQQMLRVNSQKLDAVVFTHEHKDHTAGLDDVRAYNFKQKQDMQVYGTQRVHESLKGEFPYIFSGIKYPGIPKIALNEIHKDETFEIKGLPIVPIEVMHYKLPVLGFRIGDFTYITDANFIAPEEKEKIKGSKVLVLNALRLEKHISHFNLEEALALVEELQPEMCYFTHISHLLGKHDEIEKQLPENVRLAYDLLEITLP